MPSSSGLGEVAPIWVRQSRPNSKRKDVMNNADRNGIAVLQERRYSWGALPFLVVVVLGSIGFLGMENGSDNSL